MPGSLGAGVIGHERFPAHGYVLVAPFTERKVDAGRHSASRHATENHENGQFCGTLHKVGRVGFAARVREPMAADPLTADLKECMLTERPAVGQQYLKLYELVVKIVVRDQLCRRYVRIPGVSPATALTFRTAVDIAARFRRSRDVGASFGLTSKRSRPRKAGSTPGFPG